MNEKKPAVISCDDVMRQLYAYLDGEVADIDETNIDHHLHHCRECFSRVEFEKRLKNKIRDTGATRTPADVQSRLQNLMNKF